MAESKIRDENFFIVSGWMVNRLNLKGAALHIFSIIYGFSQDGESSFTGSLQYLCDFTNTSKHTVIKALKELVEKNYVVKTENFINGVQFNTYKVNALVVQKLHRGGEEIALGGSAETAPGVVQKLHPINNIYNKSNINKDICNEVINLYHSICVSFPTIRAVSAAREKTIRARLDKYSMDDCKTVFTNAEASSFLKGSDGGWKASFDWLMKEANFLKVLEGNYQDKPKKGRKEMVPGWAKPFEPGDAELEFIRRSLTAGEDPDIADRAERLRRELQG